ncbi:MAG: FGGY family carbohydrate kinase, partial [Lacrimispora sphenoides]
MKYLIGIDVGTSATKTVLFDETGGVIASASREYPLYQPKNGWAEQKPEDWRDAVLDTLSQVMTESGVLKEDVKGIGISGQMH